MRSRRAPWIIAAAVLVLLAAAFLLKMERARESDSRVASSTPPPVEMLAGSSPDAPPAEPLVGERIMEHYADPARSAEEDLTVLARTLGNFALLVKGSDPLPLGANEDIANALRGKNKAHLRALPDDARAFNAQGQLVDRWDTPLYFHANSRDRIDIRSAGPDRQMWTADDIHRRHDGRFLRGESLLAPSLFDETAGGR